MTKPIEVGDKVAYSFAAGQQSVKFPLKVSIPRGHLTGFKHVATTPNGPIQIVMNKIRDFP